MIVKIKNFKHEILVRSFYTISLLNFQFIHSFLGEKCPQSSLREPENSIRVGNSFSCGDDRM